MSRFIQEGVGWRLGWDLTAPTYQGLIAGPGWAMELSQQEFQDFCYLAQQLSQTLSQMAAELMAAERIAVEAETARIWLEAEGFPHQYGLHVILLADRRCEGEWPAAAVVELIQAIPRLTLF